MRRWMAISGAVAGGLAGVTAAAVITAVLLWNHRTARTVARFYGWQEATAPLFSRDELVGLPDPVVRYFEFALTPGQSLVRHARIRQRGEFAIRANSWNPFTAMEYFSVRPLGFLWDARIRMAPLISFYVHDGYFAGEGAMYGALAALVPVVNQRGTPDIASGELLRYLAEGALLPTALLPREGVSWKAIDANTASATLADGATTVSCDIRFGESGEIVRTSAMRYRDVNGTPVLTPWVGHFRDYRRVNGMMIPMLGEVEWVLPGGPLSYWRGHMVDIEYGFAR